MALFLENEVVVATKYKTFVAVMKVAFFQEKVQRQRAGITIQSARDIFTRPKINLFVS